MCKGLSISKSRYPSYSNGSLADAIFDIIYIPNNNNKSELLPPIAVVVQETINKSVMADLVFHSTALYQQYKMLPVMLIVSMKGYACDKMKDEFGSKKNDISCLAKSTSCLFWAQHLYVLSWESIESFTDITPMDQLVALVYCIINKEDILKNHQDATIKLFLKLL